MKRVQTLTIVCMAALAGTLAAAAPADACAVNLGTCSGLCPVNLGKCYEDCPPDIIVNLGTCGTPPNPP